MFDAVMYEEHRRSADALAAARSQTPLATGAQLCEALRSVQATQDVLDGVAADLLALLDSTEGYAEEGASTAASWAVRELRVPVRAARRRVRAGQALHVLPMLAAAAAAGRVRAAHVDEFAAGITKVGADVMADTEDRRPPGPDHRKL